MLRPQYSDFESIYKLAEYLQKQSKENRQYRTRLFREIFTEGKERETSNGKIELSKLTPQEVVSRVWELCMEAPHLRKLPPNLINELSDIIEGIEILRSTTEDLTPLIEARLSRLRKICRYIATVAYSIPVSQNLDIKDLAEVSKSSNRREIIG
jgi:hypothetical protein